LGPNGQGKTNILEAIGLAQGLRSFRTHLKAPMVMNNTPQATILGTWQHEHRGETKLGISFTQTHRHTLLDGINVKSVEEILGIFPVVALTLADRELIYGGPAVRRMELDRILCQLHPYYYQTLKGYSDALKSRNRLLQAPRDDAAAREAFESQMATHASVIIKERARLTEQLQQELDKNFSLFAPLSETPQIFYTPHTPADLLGEKWKNNFEKERLRGLTLYGPHRDNVEILLNDQLAEEFASEGQKFSIVLALKLSGLKLLEKTLKIAPVIVADDLLLELDSQRQEKFWEIVKNWQVFASGTRPPQAGGTHAWQTWSVSNGTFILE